MVEILGMTVVDRRILFSSLYVLHKKIDMWTLPLLEKLILCSLEPNGHKYNKAAAYVTLRMFMFILIARVLALLCVILLFDSICVGKIIN